MKIVAINSVNYGSTGKIMLSIAEAARSKGYEYYSFSAPGKSMIKGIENHGFIGTRISHILHFFLGTPLGINLSIISTLQFCKKLDSIHPDIIHLHNLHGSFINLPILFNYISKNRIKTVWTLHDCWAFTGRCPHFLLTRCSRWRTGCYNCPFPKNSYPKAYIDYSRRLWKLKKKCYEKINQMTIVTPSKWLAQLVANSVLKQYPIEVINNGINLSVFRPRPSDSVRNRYGIKNGTKVILGVAFSWSERKGLDVFIELSRVLEDGYQIVLVGTDDSVDKLLPNSIITIHKTADQNELASLYSISSVFLNPTREDNFPTTNIEALACGTPVITFNTGGSPESIDCTCGTVLFSYDVCSIKKEIIRVCSSNPYTKDSCVKRAKMFDNNQRFSEYVDLYESISGSV